MPSGSRLSASGWCSSLILLAVAVTSTVGAAADDGAAARERLVAGLEADMAANPSIPGEAIAVRAPGLDVTVAAGLADVDAGTPLRAETPFRIASVTKTFVAASVLRLVEQGTGAARRADLGVRLAASRPPCCAPTATGRGRITVRQLLRHTAGLFDYAATDAVRRR